MTTIDNINIEREFLNFLRNADILTTTQRGVTTTIDTYSATGGAQTFTLTQTSGKNIRYVKQNGTSLIFGTDYTYTYSSTGQITQVIVSKVLTLGDAITIQYDYGTGDAIYPDYPRPDLSISSYPRVSFDIYNMTTTFAGYGKSYVTNISIMIDIFDISKSTANTKYKILRDAIVNNQNSFFYLSYIYPTNYHQIEPVSDFGKYKLYKIGLDIQSDNNFEIN